MVLYENESKTPTKDDKKKLYTFERKFLSGTTCVNGIWKINYNQLYQEPNINQVIRINRLKWLGHVKRMKDSNARK